MGIDGIQGKRDGLQVERQSGQLNGANGRAAPPAGRHEDQVRFSGQSMELLGIRQLVDAAPEVRKNTVEQLREQIARGAYDVPSSEIADAIVRAQLSELTGL